MRIINRAASHQQANLLCAELAIFINAHNSAFIQDSDSIGKCKEL